MPANLSPEYKKAESAFKQARDPAERLAALREMLRTIPKHKGTEHLQADIKTRIKHLSDELSGPRKGAARTGPVQVIQPEGAAQIALVGPPNAGKSTLHARLTGSTAVAAPYPFTTHEPLPGMLPFEDVHLQLVDLPPIGGDYTPGWIGNALQPADGCMLVVDLQAPDCVEQILDLRRQLAERHVHLLEEPQRRDAPVEAGEDADDIGDPFARHLPTLLVATKADLTPDQAAEIDALGELLGARFPTRSVSAETGEGLDALAPWWFDTLGVVRVYTKAPGRAPDRDRPFTVRRGDTVLDVATLVHRDIAASLKYARLWGGGQFDGQQVGRDHPVSDGDVVELHA